MGDTLTATDLFCGAGGSSLGLEAAGVTLKMAANHWALAVESHAANFTAADHDTADVSQVVPRRYPTTDILLASPECTTFSQAGPRRHEPNLFNPLGDPRVERSRATMWDVPRFAEEHRYKIVVVENVYDIMRWLCWNSWLSSMHDLGYKHRVLSLNSQFVRASETLRGDDMLWAALDALCCGKNYASDQRERLAFNLLKLMNAARAPVMVAEPKP